MLEVTLQQTWFPTNLVNHYFKWLTFEAIRDNSYVNPIIEGVERIEVNPLPYILTTKDIIEEVYI